jgi:hypothetical protein
LEREKPLQTPSGAQPAIAWRVLAAATAQRRGTRQAGRGPAPRPLERAAITLADDGQIEINKGRPLRQEIGQWLDRQALLRV